MVHKFLESWKTFNDNGRIGSVGKWLLILGAFVFGAAGVLTPPVHYIGYGLSFLGLCCLRFPLHRFPRWPMLAHAWLVVVCPRYGTKKWHNLLWAPRISCWLGLGNIERH